MAYSSIWKARVGVRKGSARADDDAEQVGHSKFCCNQVSDYHLPPIYRSNRPSKPKVDAAVDFPTQRTPHIPHFQHGYVSRLRFLPGQVRYSSGICCSEGSLQDLQENEIESNWDQVVDK